jgi:predicted lipoprotein
MKTLLPLLGALVLAVPACDEDTAAPTGGFNASALLAGVPSTVILGTYQDLEAKAIALRTAVNSLQGAPTDPNLTAAQNAWRAARRPWEQSEGFLFGPVETQGIDPSIDSWPVNRVDLDAVLASGATLNQSYIDGLEGTLKGFHTLEYLLFGTGSKTAADLTTRELDYLVGTAASLASAVTTLRTAWDPAGGNYVGTVSTAGATGNSVYISQSAALQELVNGVIAICDEVANGKISDPFDQMDRSLEESQFSNNSNLDFADNIRSVQNVYLGQYGSATTTGLRALVMAKQPSLDATIQSQLTAAITVIGEMTPTFGEAITSNPTKVEAARTAVRTLKQTLESQLLPLAQ